MPAPSNSNTVTWQFQPPPGLTWEIHKFSIIDAIMVARNQLPYHAEQDEFNLSCGPVAFAVLRQLPQFIRGSNKDGPVAWLQLSVPGPIGRDGLAECEVVPDKNELSGLSMTHAGKKVRVVILGVSMEFIELAMGQGFRL